jgi:cellulose synthase/poly-beta-1,6-N-acetylglucosamine synthase-like glycosyltransferase
MNNACKGLATAYAHDAIFYDFQPETDRDSWNQKVRWCKGGLQIFRLYLGRLMRGIFSPRFLTFFDMTNFLFCAYFTAVVATVANLIAVPLALMFGADPRQVLVMFLLMGGFVYFSLMLFSICITISDWDRISAPGWKKVLYAITFPALSSPLRLLHSLLFSKRGLSGKARRERPRNSSRLIDKI